MKIILEVPGRALEYECKPKVARPPYVLVKNWKCACGSDRVVGRNMRKDGDKSNSSDAYCQDCEKRVGILRAEGLY